MRKNINEGIDEYSIKVYYIKYPRRKFHIMVEGTIVFDRELFFRTVKEEEIIRDSVYEKVFVTFKQIRYGLYRYYAALVGLSVKEWKCRILLRYIRDYIHKEIDEFVEVVRYKKI